MHLLRADRVHLLAHDLLDLVQAAPPERQEAVDARGVLADDAGAQQQPVAGELGLGGIFLERGDVQRAHAQGDGHRCLFRVSWTCTRKDTNTAAATLAAQCPAPRRGSAHRWASGGRSRKRERAATSAQTRPRSRRPVHARRATPKRPGPSSNAPRCRKRAEHPSDAPRREDEAVVGATVGACRRSRTWSPGTA